jgi:hypothetical protein
MSEWPLSGITLIWGPGSAEVLVADMVLSSLGQVPQMVKIRSKLLVNYVIWSVDECVLGIRHIRQPRGCQCCFSPGVEDSIVVRFRRGPNRIVGASEGDTDPHEQVEERLEIVRSFMLHMRLSQGNLPQDRQ